MRENEERADYSEMDSADRPQNGERNFSHDFFIRSRPARREEFRSSGSQAKNLAIDHDVDRRIEIEFHRCAGGAAASAMLDVRAVEESGNSRSRSRRPMGAQRTYSIRPSLGSAFGAIIILPPVNLLLLKVRKRQRRRSQFVSPSARNGKARR